jgi:hypothetical protein
MAFLILRRRFMKASQHEQSSPQNEATPSTSVPWVREPDDAEKKQSKQAQSPREESQLLDEPGYGYGV